MKTTPRYALQNLYLDRDQIDTLVASCALSPSSYGEHHLPTTSIFPLYRLSSVVFSSWQSFFFTSFACSGYRYGSDSYRNQGMEEDDEVKGKGNSVNYTYRMHDPRLGRFFAVDPLTSKYPWYTPYSFSGNRVINAIELEGLEEFVVFVRPSQTDPKLQVITVYKIKEDGPLTITYHHLDKNGKLIRSENPVSQFKPNTSEDIGMNREYKKSGKNSIEAMDVSNISISSDGFFHATLAKRLDRSSRLSSLMGRTFFQYDLKINFNTDKSSVDQLGVTNIDRANEQIENLNFILSNPIEYAGANGSSSRINSLNGLDMIVTGETDSRPSKYEDANGQICGNSCLGEDRANSVLDKLSSSHPNNNSTKVINHTGKLNNDDRRSRVMFIPK